MNVGGAVSTPLLGRLRGQVANLDVRGADRQSGLVLLVDVLSTDALYATGRQGPSFQLALDQNKAAYVHRASKQ